MHAPLLLSSLFLAGCFLSPTRAVGQTAAPRPLTAADAFPVPKQGLTVRANAETKTTLHTLLDDFARVTEQHLVISLEVRQMLQASSCGLWRDVEVQPERVWEFVENLLIQSGFAIEPLTSEPPRLLAVHSLHSKDRGELRSRTPLVRAADLAVYTRHPALLITTMIDLPDTDVRTLSNSMRTMFADANTQQIIPAGNSNTLIITGFGPTVANLVETLQAADEAMRRHRERFPAEKPAPKDASANEPKRETKENPKDQEPPR